MNVNDSDQGVINDFEHARKVQLDLISTGQEALQDMIEVARESEHPRSFEVLATLMKTISDVNDRLLDGHRKKKDILRKDTKDQAMLEKPSTNTTNNIIFSGTTSEMQEKLKELQDNVIEGEFEDVERDT